MNVMGAYHARLYPGTPAERAIEPAVAALAIPYRTQFPFYLFGLCKYFPDVLFPTIGVILEIDDESHDTKEKKGADAIRTSTLRDPGYVVVRCSNAEALTDPRGTVNRLVRPLLNRQGPGLPDSPSRAKRPRKKRSQCRAPRSPGGNRPAPLPTVPQSYFPWRNHTPRLDNKTLCYR